MREKQDRERWEYNSSSLPPDAMPRIDLVEMDWRIKHRGEGSASATRQGMAYESAMVAFLLGAMWLALALLAGWVLLGLIP